MNYYQNIGVIAEENRQFSRTFASIPSHASCYLVVKKFYFECAFLQFCRVICSHCRNFILKTVMVQFPSSLNTGLSYLLAAPLGV